MKEIDQRVAILASFDGQETKIRTYLDALILCLGSKEKKEVIKLIYEFA